MIKLGYSTSVGPKPKQPIKERIKILSSVEKHAIELSYIVANRLQEDKLDDEDFENLKKFEYVSIHAPAFLFRNGDQKKQIRYPSIEAESILDQILKIAESTQAKTILFHPDLIDDFTWLNNKVGNLLAFENMDTRKSFGNTINDLKNVFTKASDARWVCDVNHLYTIDKSMKLADDFHKAFQDRLCQYHVSAYGGRHDCFHITKEDVILNGIKDFSVPMIHEGLALRDGKDFLVRENSYILEWLNKKY